MNDKAPSRREANYVRLMASIKRWQTKLAKADATMQRSIRTLGKLERQRRRMEKALSKPPSVAQEAKPVTPDDLSIPTFLQRKPLSPEAAAIEKQNAENKKAKTRGRLDKMKAKARGDLQKMPLTGKAALEAINS